MSAASITEVSTRTRLRLTRRGRFVFTALVGVPVALAAAAVVVNGGGAVATAESSTVAFEYVTVHAGESLWSLAEDLAPAADPRDVIDDIVSLNQLGSAMLEPGQRLAVPTAYAG